MGFTLFGRGFGWKNLQILVWEKPTFTSLYFTLHMSFLSIEELKELVEQSQGIVCIDLHADRAAWFRKLSPTASKNLIRQAEAKNMNCVRLVAVNSSARGRFG